MFKKKCPNCEEKVDRKFRFCPWCGYSLKRKKVEDYGMLGNNDEIQQQTNNIQLPFGLNGIFNSLVKQLEKDMSNTGGNSIPKGFKIQISSGAPKIQMMNPKISIGNSEENIVEEKISAEERNRRSKLKRIDAKSVIRRLPEGVIYEIDAPGVNSKNDISITKLEKSIEIKAYSKDKCYVKTIPMKVDILGVVAKSGKVFLKLKGE